MVPAKGPPMLKLDNLSFCFKSIAYAVILDVTEITYLS